jgi:hypothetical protein
MTSLPSSNLLEFPPSPNNTIGWGQSLQHKPLGTFKIQTKMFTIYYISLGSVARRLWCRSEQGAQASRALPSTRSGARTRATSWMFAFQREASRSLWRQFWVVEALHLQRAEHGLTIALLPEHSRVYLPST